MNTVLPLRNANTSVGPRTETVLGQFWPLHGMSLWCSKHMHWTSWCHTVKHFSENYGGYYMLKSKNETSTSVRERTIWNLFMWTIPSLLNHDNVQPSWFLGRRWNMDNDLCAEERVVWRTQQDCSGRQVRSGSPRQPERCLVQHSKGFNIQRPYYQVEPWIIFWMQPQCPHHQCLRCPTQGHRQRTCRISCVAEWSGVLAISWLTSKYVFPSHEYHKHVIKNPHENPTKVSELFHEFNIGYMLDLSCWISATIGFPIWIARHISKTY